MSHRDCFGRHLLHPLCCIAWRFSELRRYTPILLLRSVLPPSLPIFPTTNSCQTLQLLSVLFPTLAFLAWPRLEASVEVYAELGQPYRIWWLVSPRKGKPIRLKTSQISSESCLQSTTPGISELSARVPLPCN